MNAKPLTVAGILTVLMLIAVGCGGGGTTTDGTSDDSSSADGTNARTDLYGVSFTAEGLLHSLQYYLDNWANPSDVYGFETADEGYKLVAIHLSIGNNTYEDGDVSNLYYKLHYGGTEPAEMSFYGGGEDSSINRMPADYTLTSGEFWEGDLLFEVPADTTAADWTLEYNSDILDFYDDNEVVMTPLGQ